MLEIDDENFVYGLNSLKYHFSSFNRRSETLLTSADNRRSMTPVLVKERTS